ncbi:MAG: hypothetical protein OXT09_34500 [Myxococcales bacterium]|nr:hypothetical protein [Myxococcales bacterium]
MSRVDVLKSLLRSTAVSAAEGVRKLPISAAVQRLLSEAALGRAPITDAQLTAEAARVAGVTAATVRTDTERVRLHATFEDGSDVAFALRPAGVMFAPGGAKEVSFTVEPPEAADAGRARDLIGSIGSAVARRLWAPVLARAPRAPGSAPVSRQGARLYMDLRSVPEVRWGLGRRVPATVIEALSLKAIELEEAKLVLSITVPALEQMR